MNVMPELVDLIRKVFACPDVQITATTTAQDVEGWDSLSHVNLIVAAEDRFRVTFTQAELLKMRNVGDLAARVEEHQRGR